MSEHLRIGHYLLGKSIGSGGFARVREGRHELTGAKVAVKIINKAKMRNKSMISKVKREIRILKLISHPNIIKLYEVLDTSKDIFVVMELAPRGQLYDYLQEHDLSERMAKTLFLQIIQGVEAAHLHLVAHRDLKPQNILLDHNLNCKIADFGLSNLMKDGRHLRTSCGSLNYAPPEILGHRHYEGTAADVWSCGVILYTLLASALPFDEEVVSILYKKIEKAEFSIPSEVSPTARDLLKRMIVADPRERLSIREIKLHPWLRQGVPLYMRVSGSGIVFPRRMEEIDAEVLGQVESYGMESLGSNLSREQVKRMIRGRMDYSFVTAYELLHDEKSKRGRSPEKETSNGYQIMRQIKTGCVPLAREREEKGGYGFGRSFEKGVQVVFGGLLDVFRELGVNFTVKSSCELTKRRSTT